MYIYIHTYIYIYYIRAHRTLVRPRVALAKKLVSLFRERCTYFALKTPRNCLAWPHRRRGIASDGVRYVDARSSVGRRFRSVTKITKVRIGAMGEFSYCCSSAQMTHEKWL